MFTIYLRGCCGDGKHCAEMGTRPAGTGGDGDKVCGDGVGMETRSAEMRWDGDMVCGDEVGIGTVLQAQGWDGDE